MAGDELDPRAATPTGEATGAEGGDGAEGAGAPRLLTRRKFLGLGAVTVVSAGFGISTWQRRSIATMRPTLGTAPTTSTTGAPSTTTPTTVAAGAPARAAEPADPVPAGSARPAAVVLVDLRGGNDGANTVVPVSGAYHDLRPSLAVGDGELVPVAGLDGYGLHPALAPLAARWGAGRIAAVAGVGYRDPSRSHFVATDAWLSARPGRLPTSGWAGRWLELTGSSGSGPVRGISVGGDGRLLRGERAQAPRVGNPSAFRFGVGRTDIPRPVLEAWAAAAAGQPFGDWYGGALAGARGAVDVVATAVREGGVGEAGDPEPSSIAGRLELAAALVESDESVRVVNVGANGFDTHANQAATHAALLADLAHGLDLFLGRMEAAGLADRVLVITVSEFGRRAAENGSAGTDHGKAGLSLVAGPPLREPMVGAVDMGSLVDGDLAPSVDPRALFTLALDWLGGPVEEVLDGGRDDALRGLVV